MRRFVLFYARTCIKYTWLIPNPSVLSYPPPSFPFLLFSFQIPTRIKPWLYDYSFSYVIIFKIIFRGLERIATIGFKSNREFVWYIFDQKLQPAAQVSRKHSNPGDVCEIGCNQYLCKCEMEWDRPLQHLDQCPQRTFDSYYGVMAKKRKSLASSSHSVCSLALCIYCLWISLWAIRGKAITLQMLMWSRSAVTPVELCNIVPHWVLSTNTTLRLPFLSHASLSYPSQLD